MWCHVGLLLEGPTGSTGPKNAPKMQPVRSKHQDPFLRNGMELVSDYTASHISSDCYEDVVSSPSMQRRVTGWLMQCVEFGRGVGLMGSTIPVSVCSRMRNSTENTSGTIASFPGRDSKQGPTECKCVTVISDPEIRNSLCHVVRYTGGRGSFVRCVKINEFTGGPWRRYAPSCCARLTRRVT